MKIENIKFKAKCLDNQEWTCGFFYKENDNTYIIEDRQKECMLNRNIPYKVDPDTVCQFTGLFDKNGKEIYEGDVLRSDDFPFSFINKQKTYHDLRFGSIVWDEARGKYFMLCRTNKKINVDKYFEGVHLDINQLWCSNFEVVGNVHDPEWQKKLDIKKE